MKTLTAILLTLCSFLLLFAGFFHEISAITQDLGRHIKMGEIIWQTQTVPKTNLFSYTYPDFPFINHHWLSEVIFYHIFQIGGFQALLFSGIFLAFCAFGIVFFTSLSKPLTYSTLLAASAASLLYLRILFERTDIRPELFSFLFLSVFITILYAYKRSYTPWIFLLIPLTVLWVNIHIYFFVGLVVLGLFVLDMLITDHRTLFAKKRWMKKQIVLLLVFISSLAGILLNPNGLHGALYPFQVFQNYGYSIEENQNIFFLQQHFPKPTIAYFITGVLALFLSLTLTVRHTKPIDWLLAITFTAAGALAVRNLPLFVFATFIPFAYSLTVLLRTIPLLFLKTERTKQFFTTGSVVFLCVGLLWSVQSVWEQKPPSMQEAYGAKKAVDFLLAQKLQGPIFNNFDIGSYLDYRLYPEEKVFIDGRPEAYPATFIQDVYIPMQENPAVFAEVEKQYNFNTIFFSHTDQTPWAEAFLAQIVQNPNWHMVYLDEYIVIFVKDIPAHTKIIAQFTMNQKSLHANAFQKKDRQALLRLTSFFQKVQWKEQEEHMYPKILQVDPTNCFALYNSALLFQQTQSPAALTYIQKYNSFCK